MKRSFSLLLSLILIFSMSVSSAIFASAAPATEARELVNVVFDTTGRTYSEYNADISAYIAVNYMTKEAYAADANAFQIRSTRQEKTMRFTLASPDVNSANPTAGIYTLSGKMLGDKATSDGYIDFSTAYVQLNRTSSGKTADASPTGLTADTWLDFSYTVDLDNGEFTVKYRNPADEEGVYEFNNTDTFTPGTAFNDLYFQLLYSDAASVVAFKDLKFEMSSGAKEASIISVNDSAQVEARQKELTFTLDENIPNLTAENITATPQNGGSANVCSSFTVTDNGDSYTVSAVFAQRFTENTVYTLAINSSVYEGYKAKNADGSIGDVNTAGLSMDFEVGDYTINMTGTGKIVKNIYDTVGKKFSGYTKVTEYSTSNNFQPNYIVSGNTSTVLTAINVQNTVRDNGTDGSMILERLNKGNAARDMYITYSNPMSASMVGKYTISGKFFTNKAKADSELADLAAADLKLNNNSSPHAKHTLTGLNANTWYDFVYEVDLTVSPGTFKVTYTAEGAAAPDYSQTKTFTTGVFSSIRADVDLSNDYTAFDANGYYVKYKDLKMDVELDKAKILSVNSDAVVAPNQKELSFTIDEIIPGLADNPENIWVEDASQNENKVTAVTVTGTAAPYTVNVTLENNLAAWSDYKLILSEDIYADCGEVNVDGDLIVPVPMPDSEFTKAFSTASTGFDMREKSITTDSDSVDYVMEYTYSESNCPPLTLLAPVYNSEGVMVGLVANSVPGANLPANGETEEVAISAPFANGQSAKLIAVSGWSGKTPYFGRYWGVNDTPKTLESYSSAEPITLGDFDYENYKINVGVVASDGQVSGVLYVYEENSSLSDSVLPVYVDYITTAADGTFALDIPFADTIDDTTGTYKVEFCAEGIATVSDTFTVYDADDIKAQKQQAIYDAAKLATTVGTLKQVICGTDANETVINDNFDVFYADINQSVYDSVKNKTSIYSRLLPAVAQATDYNNLVTLFNNAANYVYQQENTRPSSPSSDNKSYGGSSVVIKEDVTPTVTPSVPGQPDDETTVSTSAFADMKGHWAEEVVNELFERGIMNGYEDGAFRGENSITRAELAKTIMSALEIATADGASYTDVDAGSWYAPYVAGASKAGIITGFADGTFAPDAFVTRQDAVLMLYRAMSKDNELTVGYTFFKDDLDIDDYASDAVRCLGDLKIVTGDTAVRFNPKNQITRAEVAAIICRALDYIESH